MKLKFKAAFIGASLILSFASVASAATVHQYYTQQVTAYVAASGAKTASGTTPTQYQSAAVHPKVWGSVSSGPKIPYGTVIACAQPLKLTSSYSRGTFTVEDLGQVNNENNRTADWFDVYFGINYTVNTADALLFGDSTRTDYTAIF